MAGNSARRGATRRAGSKKGMRVGSGGQRRKSLEGKGPTPRAEDRPGHPKARRTAGTRRPPATTQAQDRRPVDRGRRDGAEIVAGRNAVLEALRACAPVKTLYVAERIDLDDRVREVLRISAARSLPLLQAPRTELDRISGNAVHQGVVLSVPPYEYVHPDELLTAVPDGAAPLVVALDGVTDPRNLGAVVRSAAAFGAHGVVVPERRSAGMTAGAWKASAGAAARLPVARATNLARQLHVYAEAGLFVMGLAADGTTVIGNVGIATAPLCVVVGSEGSGLSRVVQHACDVLARIPTAPEVESLNAGVAAGIALYEVARARQVAP